MVRIISILVLILLTNVAYSANTKTIVKNIQDGIRVIFWVSDPETFNVTYNGRDLVIDLGNKAPASIAINDPLIKNVSIINGKIKLSFSEQIRYRKFISEQYIGVDVVSWNKSEKNEGQKPTPAESLIKEAPPKEEAKQKEPISKEIKRSEPKKETSKPALEEKETVKDPITKVTTKPLAPQPGIKSATVNAPKSEKNKPPIAKTVTTKIPEVKAPEQPKNATKPSIQEKPIQEKAKAPQSAPATPSPIAPEPGAAPITPVTATTTPGVPIQNVKQTIIPENQGNYIQFTKTSTETTIIFPWSAPVPAASFSRGGYAYVIFADYQNPPRIPKEIPADIGSIEFSSKDGFVIYRLNMSRKNIDLVRNGNNWRFIIPTSPNKPKLPTKLKPVEYQDDNLILEIAYIDKYLEFTDPLIGDQLLIMGSANDTYYVDTQRSSADYEILETFQGIVIVKNNDRLKVVLDKNKVILTSPSTKKKQYGKNEFINAISYFNCEDGKKVKNIDFYPNLKSLARNLVDSKDNEVKPQELMPIIKLYLQNGMLKEAVGLLNLIEDRYTEFWNSEQEPKVLRAIAEFLDNRPSAAKKIWEDIDFGRIHPKFHNELLSWMAATYFTLNPEYNKNQINFIQYEKYYFSKYPKEIKLKLALLDLDYKIQNNNMKEADKIIKYLNDNGYKNNNDFKYLKLIYFEKNDFKDEFTKLAKELSEQYLDPRNRFRAIVREIEYKLSQNTLSKKEAIEQLNKVKFTWRGDDNEVNYLDLLAQLYWEEKLYAKAFDSWHQIVNNFPSNPSSILIAAKMSENYTDLILNNNVRYKLDDFELVALYEEFQELTPIGKTGDLINRAIIARLFRLDLLDKAAEILNHQIQYRTNGTLRNRLIADYAYIQILNKKPDQAINALELPLDAELDHDLARELFFLKIKALKDLGNTDQAISILNYRLENESRIMLMDILWAKQDWNNIKKYFDGFTEGLWEFHLPPTELQQKFIVKLAVAYAMLRDFDSVRTIAKRFLGQIEPGSICYELLAFISQERSKLSIQSINSDLGVDQFEQFIKDYRQKLENQNF